MCDLTPMAHYPPHFSDFFIGQGLWLLFALLVFYRIKPALGIDLIPGILWGSGTGSRKSLIGEMAKYSKLRMKILSGRSDSNIDFYDLCGFLLHLGFEERIKGDHHIFTS